MTGPLEWAGVCKAIIIGRSIVHYCSPAAIGMMDEMDPVVQLTTHLALYS